MCSSTSATRGSTRASGTADGRASRRVAEEPQATRVRGESVIRAVVVELARFARRNTLAAAGGLVGVLIVVVAVAGPPLAPRDPLKADFRRMNKPPDAQSLLGTDQVGRGTLSPVIYRAPTPPFLALPALLPR